MSTNSHGNTYILSNYAQKSPQTLIWANDVKASGGLPNTKSWSLFKLVMFGKGFFWRPQDVRLQNL
jgi:hypothetical protein